MSNGFLISNLLFLISIYGIIHFDYLINYHYCKWIDVAHISKWLKVKKHKIGPEGSKYRQAPKEQFQSHPHFEVEIETKRVKEELLRRGVHRERERERAKRARCATTPSSSRGSGMLPGPSQRRVAMFYEVANRCQLCLVILDFTGRSRRCINSLTNKILIVGRDNRVGQPR